jgi:hypothetical protein
LDFDDAIAITK